jgi:hypothetical protein
LGIEPIILFSAKYKLYRENIVFSGIKIYFLQPFLKIVFKDKKYVEKIGFTQNKERQYAESIAATGNQIFNK